jgi:hypothetical protein
MSILPLTSCSFDDPTEATVYVQVVNDTNHAVTVSDCGTGDGPCRKQLFESSVLSPGERLPAVASCCFISGNARPRGIGTWRQRLSRDYG